MVQPGNGCVDDAPKHYRNRHAQGLTRENREHNGGHERRDMIEKSSTPKPSARMMARNRFEGYVFMLFELTCMLSH